MTTPSLNFAAPFVPAIKPSTIFKLPSNLRRKHLFRKAKLAEGAKRYEHMVRFMKEIVQITHPALDITPKERCLLGAAFKNFFAQARGSLRMVSTTTQSWHGEFTGPAAASYLLKSKAEIADICTEIIELIDRRLFPSAVTKESKLYYLTLKGDFSWYLAEIKGPTEGKLEEAAAQSAFMDASQFGKDLDVMNPYRLALQLSVVEHSLKFCNAPLEADTALDQVLNMPAIMEPERRPAVSLLSFEGGFQMLANLLTMKRVLVDQAP